MQYLTRWTSLVASSFAFNCRVGNFVAHMVSCFLKQSSLEVLQKSTTPRKELFALLVLLLTEQRCIDWLQSSPIFFDMKDYSYDAQWGV